MIVLFSAYSYVALYLTISIEYMNIGIRNVLIPFVLFRTISSGFSIFVSVCSCFCYFYLIVSCSNPMF